jgi:hypothetical protein
MSVPNTAERDPAGEFHRDEVPEMPSSVYARPEELMRLALLLLLVSTSPPFVVSH